MIISLAKSAGQTSRVSDRRSLIPDGMVGFVKQIPPGGAKGNYGSGLRRNRGVGGGRGRLRRHFPTIVTGSSSRCDNATVKLSRARKILSQFKFERDDPLEVSG